MTVRSNSCRDRDSTSGSASERPQPVPGVGERLEHAHRQQVARVEEADTPAHGRETTRERDVFDDVVLHQLQPPDVEEPSTVERRALAVAEQSLGAAALRPRWTEPVDQGRQHRRVQPAAPGGRAVEPTRHREEVEAVAGRPSHQRGGQHRIRPCVGVERHHPFSGGSPDSLLQRPGLARPAVGEWGALDHPCAGPSSDRGGVVGRLVVDHDHLVDAGGADDRVEQRPDPACFVTSGDHDADRLERSDRRSHRRRRVRGLGEAAQCDGAGGDASDDRDDPEEAAKRRHRARSSVIMSATILALVVTNGRPPPGWLEPPTRYNPGRAPRLAGRTNAARRPFDEVP